MRKSSTFHKSEHLVQTLGFCHHLLLHPFTYISFPYIFPCNPITYILIHTFTSYTYLFTQSPNTYTDIYTSYIYIYTYSCIYAP